MYGQNYQKPPGPWEQSSRDFNPPFTPQDNPPTYQNHEQDFSSYGDRGGYENYSNGSEARGRDPNSRYQSRPRDRRDSFESNRSNRQRPRSPGNYRHRSRSRSPGRYEREWDRGKRAHSPPNSRHGRDNDGRDHDHDRDQRKPFREDPPSRTVMLRGLPSNCFEAEIRHVLDPQISAFVDVRVPRSLEGGNRGFGFVEFADMATAVSWMEYNQATVFINNQRVGAHFCEDREILRKRDTAPDTRPPRSVLTTQTDWECSRCGCNNFRHRNSCFRCEALRSEAESVVVPSADEQVGLTPCNTLLLRNLDSQTDDLKVTQALYNIMGTAGIKTVKVMKDPRSQASLGFGFVQFKVLHDSTEMYNCLMRVNPPLTIDGKQVSISFAKSPLNEIFGQPQSVQMQNTPDNLSRSGYGQGNDVNSAAAVAQMALQHMQKTQQSANIIQQHMLGQPNVSTYQYDSSSGYFFDPNSQLYYDPKTQYFYNPQTQQYLLWNAQTMTYSVVSPSVPSAPPVTAAAPESLQQPFKPAEEEPSKLETEKEKQARKIVQDMEKWAKSQNVKSAQKKPAPPPEVKIGAVASVFYDDDEESTHSEIPHAKLSYKSISMPSAVQSVQSTGNSLAVESPKTPHPDTINRDRSISPTSPISASDQKAIANQQAAEEKLVDWERMACLLCKRQLQTKDLLQKHLEMSDLHLRNLEAHRRTTMTDAQIEEMEARDRDAKYRDRAKERRQKYGEAESIPPFHSFSKSSKRSAMETAPETTDDADESVAPGVGSGNVGAKLMKAMGWSEGKGLGKSKQGILDPVEAKGHAGTTGLGSSEGAADILPTDTYADKVRKTMRQRFQQM